MVLRSSRTASPILAAVLYKNAIIAISLWHPALQRRCSISACENGFLIILGTLIFLSLRMGFRDMYPSSLIHAKKLLRYLLIVSM
jgi:hypothetical protein